jgi:Flp pilus assembly protein TadB
VTAGIALAAARIAATRPRRRRLDAPVGAGLDTLTTGLSWWLGLFLIPALAISARHSETRLLWAAALFVLTATLVCAAWDRQTRRRCRRLSSALATASPLGAGSDRANA